jgi:hypothetical protein
LVKHTDGPKLQRRSLCSPYHTPVAKQRRRAGVREDPKQIRRLLRAVAKVPQRLAMETRRVETRGGSDGGRNKSSKGCRGLWNRMFLRAPNVTVRAGEGADLGHVQIDCVVERLNCPWNPTRAASVVDVMLTVTYPSSSGLVETPATPCESRAARLPWRPRHRKLVLCVLQLP